MKDKLVRLAFVRGPDGAPLYLTDLPPASTRRWVARRKAEVVAAVHGGLLSLDEACERYALSVEEFSAWERAFGRSGPMGLQNKQIQHHRQNRHGGVERGGQTVEFDLQARRG
jgi:hypothetical protein